MTRYEKDDIAGRAIEGVLDENGEEWVILSIPAIAEGLLHPDDPRQDGEALWPYKYPEQKLRKIRATIGEFEWSAQYQQNPIPSGGLLFKPELFEVVDYVPECTQVVRFYDLAVTKNKTSDYTAGVKMGLTPDNRPVVLDVYRAQKPLPEIQEAIVSNARIDGTQVFIRLEAEKAGIIGLDYLLRDKRLNLYTLDIKAPDGDKYTRATPFAARVNASHALLVRGAWNHAYLEELGAFNKGTNDDMVDASSGAYDMLAGGFGTELLFEVNNELEDND
jgi:predicted phage terminase large subunit-like protein